MIPALVVIAQEVHIAGTDIVEIIEGPKRRQVPDHVLAGIQLVGIAEKQPRKIPALGLERPMLQAFGQMLFRLVLGKAGVDGYPCEGNRSPSGKKIMDFRYDMAPRGKRLTVRVMDALLAAFETAPLHIGYFSVRRIPTVISRGTTAWRRRCGSEGEDQMSEYALFLRGLIDHPRNVSAPLRALQPGALAAAIAAQIDPQRAGLVVELGPGTGVVTQALLDRGIARNRLIVIET